MLAVLIPTSGVLASYTAFKWGPSTYTVAPGIATTLWKGKRWSLGEVTNAGVTSTKTSTTSTSTGGTVLAGPAVEFRHGGWGIDLVVLGQYSTVSASSTGKVGWTIDLLFRHTLR